MKVIMVVLISSALAVAAIVVYGYLFGLQSRPNQPVIWSDVLYLPLIALLGGALAALQLVLRSHRDRFTLRDGADLGVSAGTATGLFLLVWQLLFTVVVNLILERPGLFVIVAAHPLNPTQRLVGLVLLLMFTFAYGLAECVAAMAGGVLAGCIATALAGARDIRA